MEARAIAGRERLEDATSEQEDGLEIIEKPVSVEEAIEKVGVGYSQYVLLVLCGLTFVSDAAEVTFLSFVTEQLKCEWGLSGNQETLIAQAVFVGMIIGSPLWGIIADKVGRRPAFLVSSATICGFGFATALCQDYIQLVICRGIVGIGVAGLPVGFDILAEALPSKARGGFLLYIEYFWTFGSIYVTICAYLTLEPIGWQVFTALAAIPTLLSTIFGFFMLPESPRWLAEENRNKEALTIVNKWAKDNGSNLRFQQLAEEPARDPGASHGPLDLIKDRKLRKNTMLMSIGWFAFGLAYYGVVCMLPRILRFEQLEEQSDFLCAEATNLAEAQAFNCSEAVLDNIRLQAGGILPITGGGILPPVMYTPPDMAPPVTLGQITPVTPPTLPPYVPPVPPPVTLPAAPDASFEEVPERLLGEHKRCHINFDFQDIGYSALAEILGVAIAIMIINNPGRVLTQVVFFSFGGVCAIVLGFPKQIPRLVLTLASSGARLAEMGGSCAMWVHTPELFPTYLRAEAHGILNLWSKVGATVAQYLISDSVDQWLCGILIGVTSFAAALAVWFLPETAGKTLGADAVTQESESESEDDDEENVDGQSSEQ